MGRAVCRTACCWWCSDLGLSGRRREPKAAFGDEHRPLGSAGPKGDGGGRAGEAPTEHELESWQSFKNCLTSGWTRRTRRPRVSRDVGRLVTRNVLGYTRPGDPWVQAQGVGQVLRDRVKGRCPSTRRRTVAPDLGPLERCHFATRHGPARAEPSSPRG